MPVKDLQTTLIGATAGAVAGFLVSVLTSRWKLWRLHHNLQLEQQQTPGNHVSARVHNGYITSLNAAYAYITIDHEIRDILNPPGGEGAFISKDCPCIVREDRLCWSVTAPDSNPPKVDIYPGERQSLCICNLGPDWIEFPSEDGWGTMGRAARVFLVKKKYRARIKIVSKDAQAKEFSVLIDPGNLRSPLSVLNN
jgi:hypothetical protein